MGEIQPCGRKKREAIKLGRHYHAETVTQRVYSHTGKIQLGSRWSSHTLVLTLEEHTVTLKRIDAQSCRKLQMLGGGFSWSSRERTWNNKEIT